MSCQFRYVENRDEHQVTLRLFRKEGRPFGEVTGPRIASGGGAVDTSQKVWPTDPETAFASAIRLANLGDCEVVVTGDLDIWSETWGRVNLGEYRARHSSRERGSVRAA